LRIILFLAEPAWLEFSFGKDAQEPVNNR